MKKRLALLTALLMLSLCACGSGTVESDGESATEVTTSISDERTATQPEAEDASVEPGPQTETNGILVAYFSATGTTKGVAEKIAAVTGGTLYEIVPSEPYTDSDLDYNDDNSRTTVEMNTPDARPELSGKPLSLEGFSTVYLGYPIWWGDAPRIMSTFVEQYNFEGKTVIPFCTSGSSDIGKSGNHLAKQAGGGNWLDGQRFDGGVSERELRSWIAGLR